MTTPRFARPLLALAMLAPAMACDTEPSEPEALELDELDGLELPTPDQLAADSAYMREVFEDHQGPGAMRIDLSDDLQYRYVIHRMRASGMSPLTSPELFDRVVAARHRAVDGLVPRNGDRCDMFITPKDGTQGELDTLGRATCVGGADYSQIQVCHYDDAGVLLNCTLNEEFGGTIATDLETATVLDLGSADGFSYNLPSAGGEEFFFDATPLLSTNDPATLPIDSPRDLTGNNSVMVCLERSTNSTDCDYKHSKYDAPCNGDDLCNNVNDPLFPVWNTDGSGNYQNSRLYMPLATTDQGRPVNAQATIHSAHAWLTLKGAGESTPAGGLCSADFKNADYLHFDPMNPFLKRLLIDEFALDIGNAVWPDHCVDNRADVDLHVEVIIQNGQTFQPYVWDSGDNLTGNQPDYIEIAWGCLPPGTEITLDGGAELAIEDIEIGDRVVADDDGGVLTVVDIMDGHEDEPLVVIEDSIGHVVSMTATHPVPTLDGEVLAARELAVGDRIETEDGVAHVVSVTREEYDGDVYNLILGTPEELEARGDDTTMVANHVVVGDARMQQTLGRELAAAATAESEQAPVPPELYVDYMSSQVRAFVRKLRD